MGLLDSLYNAQAVLGTPNVQSPDGGLNNLTALDPTVAANAQNMARMNFFAQLAAAGAPSRDPAHASLAFGLANGITGSQNAYNNALNAQMQQYQNAMKLNQAKAGVAMQQQIMQGMDPRIAAMRAQAMGIAPQGAQAGGQPGGLLGGGAVGGQAPQGQGQPASAGAAVQQNPGVQLPFTGSADNNGAAVAQQPAQSADAAIAQPASGAAAQMNPAARMVAAGEPSLLRINGMNGTDAALYYASDPQGYMQTYGKQFEPMALRPGQFVMQNGKMVANAPFITAGQGIGPDGQVVNLPGYLPSKVQEGLANNYVADQDKLVNVVAHTPQGDVPTQITMAQFKAAPAGTYQTDLSPYQKGVQEGTARMQTTLIPGGVPDSQGNMHAATEWGVAGGGNGLLGIVPATPDVSGQLGYGPGSAGSFAPVPGVGTPHGVVGMPNGAPPALAAAGVPSLPLARPGSPVPSQVPPGVPGAGPQGAILKLGPQKQSDLDATAKVGGDYVTSVNAKREAIANSRIGVGQLIMSADQAITGPGTPAYNKMANAINAIVPGAMSGRVSAQQVFDKVSTKYSMDLARQMGTREAATVVNQIRSAMPNMSTLNQATHVVGAMVNADNDYGDLQRFYVNGLMQRGYSSTQAANMWDRHSAGLGELLTVRNLPPPERAAYFAGKAGAQRMSNLRAITQRESGGDGVLTYMRELPRPIY